MGVGMGEEEGRGCLAHDEFFIECARQWTALSYCPIVHLSELPTIPASVPFAFGFLAVPRPPLTFHSLSTRSDHRSPGLTWSPPPVQSAAQRCRIQQLLDTHESDSLSASLGR